MSPPLDPLLIHRRDFGIQLLRLGRSWRQAVDTELSRYGLTGATWRPLYHVGNLGGGVRLKDLAEALDMERPSLGQLVDRLERDGLVERACAPDDRRGKVIHLTPAGREIYCRTLRVGAEVAARLLADVSDEELAVCTSVFARVATAAAEKSDEVESP